MPDLPDRWILLGLNGAFVTLSRAAPPTEADILHASQQLDQQGLIGWLVQLHGDFYNRNRRVQLTMLRLMSRKEGLFDMAEDAFHKRRKELFKRLAAEKNASTQK
jgi:hypothetical protein